MILELVEIDRPKSLGEKIAEYAARPPKPILRFYGDFISDQVEHGKQISFAVRNGVPLPLLYGIYVTAQYNGFTDYVEKTDHIGPFSVDNWRLIIDTTGPAQLQIRVGLIPFEILTDRAEIMLGDEG